jgi:hypothetical protein
LLSNGGVLVVSGPNFSAIPTLLKRMLGWGDYAKLREFAESGVNTYGRRRVVREMENTGLEVTELRWVTLIPQRNLTVAHRWLGRYMADGWIIQARIGHK